MKGLEKWFTDFGRGLLSYVEAFKFVYIYKLWYYFAFPAVFLVALMFETNVLFDDIKDANFGTIPGSEEDWDYGALIISIKTIGYFITKYMKSYVVLILMIPILSMLSLSTERRMTGNTYPFNWKQLIVDIRRGSNIAATNMIIQMLILAGWFLLKLIIPFLEPASPYVVFCVGFYFYGFSLMDYTNERLRLDISESMSFIRNHSGMAISIGGVFSCIFVIPYAGMIIAPIVGVVAATVAIHKTVDLSKNRFAIREDDSEAPKKLEPEPKQ